MAAKTSVTESSVHTGLVTALPVVESSTTSRVVVHNELLRVVEFTFDAGEALTEHASPKAAVVQLLEGEMRFSVEGKESTLQPGDVVYLAPDAPHALVAVTACRMSLVMVEAAQYRGGDK